MACEGARRSRRCTLNIEVVFDNPWQRKQRPTQILIHSMSPTVFYGFVLLVLKYQTLTCSDYVSAKLSGLGGGVEVQCVPFLVACAEPLAKPCYYSRFFCGECGCGSSFPILGLRRPSLWYQRCLHTKRNFALSHGQLIKAGRRELESDR